MQQNLPDTIALLERFPATLSALLRNLPSSWTNFNEGGRTFTAVEVVAHLIHSEQTNWIPRLQTILEYGESQMFRSFNREANSRQAEAKTLGELLDEFAQTRADTLAQLHALNLTPQDFARRGLHPSLGPVTLSQLLATWVIHDMTHLHQLSRILAHQYRDAVGPFINFLGVLQCDGHSRPA